MDSRHSTFQDDKWKIDRINTVFESFDEQLDLDYMIGQSLDLFENEQPGPLELQLAKFYDTINSQETIIDNYNERAEFLANIYHEAYSHWNN